METVPGRHEEINMPDLFNKEEMGQFVDTLRTRVKPRGVKQLRICAQIVYRSLCRIERAQRDMQRIIRSVNGHATEVQQQFYTERKVKTAAHRFYTAMSDAALTQYSKVLGFGYGLDRETMITRLVEAHVENERSNAWAEAAQLAEQSGYIGVEETAKVLHASNTDN